MGKKKGDDGPLTESERRHQESQDRLSAQRRAAEERTGKRVDLIGDGEWAGGT